MTAATIPTHRDSTVMFSAVMQMTKIVKMMRLVVVIGACYLRSPT